MRYFYSHGSFTTSRLLNHTSSDSSGPQTANLVLSGLQAKKATPWLCRSRLLECLSVMVSGSKSKMLTCLSLPPEANLRPSGEKRQYHTSSQCSLNTCIVSQGKSSSAHLWSYKKIQLFHIRVFPNENSWCQIMF